MRAAVIVFPGSNCDRDLAVALRAGGAEVEMVWHKEHDLPARTDLVALPGGFSFGDYLRCGAIAARAPIMAAVARHVAAGGYGLGVCNGFQVMQEAGLLPGALMRNAGLTFLCAPAELEVASCDSVFTRGYRAQEHVTFPVAHHDGNFLAEPALLAALEAEDRVAFRYLRDMNGSVGRIAGVLSANRRVLGLMPHPERAADPALGLSDGQILFASLATSLADA